MKKASEQEFVELLGRNQPRLRRLCRSFARSQAELEELEAEVGYQLWRSYPNFDGRSSLDTWLYRVALNNLLLYRRRETSRKEKLKAYEREPRPSAQPSLAEQKLHQEEQKSMLDRAMKDLSEGDRALLVLHLEGLDQKTIGEVLGLTVNHVGVKLHRIRKRLKAQLQGDQDEP